MVHYHGPECPRYVYEFYAEDGTALYVGCTNNIAHRLSHHASGREWFPDVARIEVNKHPDKASGLAAERDRIATLNPTYNRVFTTHDTPRLRICKRCHCGMHSECLGVNRDGDPCPCKCCASWKETCAS